MQLSAALTAPRTATDFFLVLAYNRGEAAHWRAATIEYSIYWAKAEESLATAELCFEQDWYNSCANRCYYAMFQCTIAALIRFHTTPTEHRTHKYVAASVAGYLVKQRKLLPGRFGTLYCEVENTRHKGDYDPMSVTRREAAKALRIAQEFVAVLREATR